jgi:hypothetical protein
MQIQRKHLFPEDFSAESERIGMMSTAYNESFFLLGGRRMAKLFILLPNIRDARSALAFGVVPANARDMTRAPKV